jgi:hypothetical protein
MAINQNHLFEELEGVKCAIVEKNADQERVNFLKPLLELNGYTVIVVNSPPPKTPVEGEVPVTFTIGVTDVMFNSTNAIFGRLLKTPEGRTVTLAYWNQKENLADDGVPYFEKK